MSDVYIGTVTLTVNASISPLKVIYNSSGKAIALAEMTSTDKINTDNLPIDESEDLLSNSDNMIPSSASCKSYIDNRSRFPLTYIDTTEEVEIGEKQEYAILSGIINILGEVSIKSDAIMFIGTGIN